MRFVGLAALALGCLLTGCGGGSGGSAGPNPGTISFGLAEANHQVQHPTTSFGPDDQLAYVARLKTSQKIQPHVVIRESFVRVRADGKEQPIMSDSFALPIALHGYVTFKGISIAQLYRVGFVAPGTYRVRLRRGGELLAEGTFQLK